MDEKHLTFSDRDEYDRKGIATKIATLLEKNIPISPMIIDGNFGQGKTEFCFKLINLLEEKKRKCIYIDSFKNDHSDDPLLTIFSAIVSKLDNPKTAMDLKKAALPLLGFGVKTLGKAGLSWVLKKDIDLLSDDFEDVISETGNAVLNSISKKLISDYQNLETNLLALRNALEFATTDNNLIVFVDELDRCRPSFAVEILEKIKHVFDISSITFVLITNSKQLKASINHIYGEDIDAEDYLNKFINLTIRLNQKSGLGEQIILNSIQHFESLVRESDDLSLKEDEGGHLNVFTKNFIGIHSFSLRQVERLVTKIRVFEALSKGPLHKMNIESGLIVIALIFIDFLFPCLADKIENGSFSGAEINEALLMGKVNQDSDWSTLDYYSAMTKVMDLGKDQVSDEVVKQHLPQIKQGFRYYGHSSLGQAIKGRHMELIRDIRLN